MTSENYLVTIVFKFSVDFFDSENESRLMFLTLDRVVAILYRSEAPLQECVVLQMTYVSGALVLYKIITNQLACC